MTPIVVPFGLAALLMADPGQSARSGDGQSPAVAEIDRGDRVEVIAADNATIRGRFDRVTPDAIVVETAGGPERFALSTVQSITRVGDTLFNGSFIGAAAGGAASLLLVARICSNTQCADTSSSLDPRLTLAGAAIGAGVGALIDGARAGRTLVYRAGAGQVLRARERTAAMRTHSVIVGRVGLARLTDDEGSLGHGTTVGTGMVVPIRGRLSLQVEYARHTRARQLEFGGGFFGTEQIVTAKGLWYFRPGAALRPYAGLGLGLMDSTRRSEAPALTAPPAARLSSPSTTSRYHTRSAVLGFATGAEVPLASHVSAVGDLTLDIANAGALASTRLTIGAGWRF